MSQTSKLSKLDRAAPAAKRSKSKRKANAPGLDFIQQQHQCLQPQLHGRARQRELGHVCAARKDWVRAASPLKMGLISLETMYYLVMYRHSFDVSFMYLKCISSVVFGASGRLVSLCIVYVSCRV